MVGSLQKKSREQLQAEFDAVLGDYNLTPQKPTTYRRTILKEDRCWVILPNEVKISQVVADLGRPLGERYLLILSRLYVRGLFRKKKHNDLGNFVPIHRDELRRLGGESYPDLMKYGQDEKHLVKSPKQFVVGLRANEYRLNQQTFSLQTQQRYELTTKAAIRIRTDAPTLSRTDYIEVGPVYRKIAESVDGLKFDYDAAMQYVSKLTGGEGKNYRRNVIEQLLAGEFLWSHDKQGRNYTIIVNVPRDIRQFFSHSAGPLFTVDVSSSQPLLHLLLYPSPCAEEKKYRDIVENGRFLDYINQAAGKPFNLVVESERGELKEAVFREIFYRYKEGKKGAKGKFAAVFKVEFPILWDVLNAVKIDGASKLPKEMQRTEADLIREAVDTIKGNAYPLITIHDAIVTTKDGLADVRHALKQAFAQYGFSPKLTEKLLTI